MISRLNFAKRFDIEARLMNYDGIWAVDSTLTNDLTYCFDSNKFAVLRSDGAIFCPLHEVPKLADKMMPAVRREILDIYEGWKK